MMSPHQLLECRIQPKDRPIIALDTQILLAATLGRDLDSLALVEKVGDMAERREVMILETADTLDEVRFKGMQLKKNAGDSCRLDLVESILDQATVVKFPPERCPWDDELHSLGRLNVLYFRLVADEMAEILATNNRGLLRANRNFLQDDPNLGRITTPSNCLKFLDTLDRIFQLNQAV